MDKPFKILMRSLFFIPGHVPKYLEKIHHLSADVFILDLEDSVPVNYKEVSRKNISEFLVNPIQNKKFVVRINEFSENCLISDLEACVHPSLTGIMPSKVKNVDDIRFLDAILTQLESHKGIELGKIKILPLIETLDAFQNVGDIAKCSNRLIGLAFGGEDYLNELGGEHGKEDHTFDYPRTRIAIAAKAANIQALDTPYLDVQNHKGFIDRERKSRDLGYEGCLLIHPSQIEMAHLCFSPSDEEIDFAKKVHDAVQNSKDNGLSVVLLDGVLVGPPMQKKAFKILETVKLIELANNE